MRIRTHFSIVLLASLGAGDLRAIDKNGVAPQAISLPSGPGSIQGLGESFQPQLNTGSGSTGVKLALPKGPGGITPDLSLVYNSGSGNGSLGLGWSLSGMLSVRRSTDRGVPRYVDGPDGADNDADGEVDNPEAFDAFTGANGEGLVTLPDGSFRAENESAFLRYARNGAGWEARARNGFRYLFGLGAQARIEQDGRVFEWCLEQVIDPNGNTIDYQYLPDPDAPAQKHLRLLRWGSPQAYLALVLSHEAGRPDVVTSYRPGFELRTSLRLVAIDVVSHGIPAPPAALRADFDGAPGVPEVLVRRYRLEYQEGVHLSLLSRVTQLGHDGATALPPSTYTYTSWAPPDNVAAAIIRSRDAPAAGFESPSVELIDMNGDGLPDLLSTAGSQHRAFLNRGVDAGGRLGWSPGQPVGNAPTIDIASDKTHLADATADGLSDLLVKVTNTSFLCFDNTSQNAWTGSPFPISNTDTWPIWPHDGAGGALSRSFDSDYSRSNDVLHTSQTGYQLWLLLPGGRFSRELRFPPLSVDGQIFRFDLPGTHIADLNGDRLQDLAWLQSSRVVYFPSRGRGEFAPPVTLPLGRTLLTAEIERSDFSDIDGDGLVDLTVVRPASLPNGVIYWLNRFEQGLDGPRSVLGLPAQGTGDALRWADLNGNGTTDIVISQTQAAPGERILVVDLVPEGKPFLLREADNGIGRRIRMDYESSTAQMVRAAAASRPWATRMPLAVTVVGRIAEEDGLSPAYERSITYRDPHYDPVKQEFRGFATAELREEGDASAAARVERFAFDTGREEPCLKGKQLATEVLGDYGKLFERTETTWGVRILAEGVDGRPVCQTFGASQDRTVHEGEAAGISIRTESEYDVHGNVVLERRLGVVEAAGDEIVTERAYEIRLADWRLDLLSRETVRDGVGRLMEDRRSTFDNRGNLEQQEAWLDTESRWVVSIRQRFDAFGNVIETTDPRGHRRSVDFDPLLHAWPTAETAHLDDRDLFMSAEYDLGLGVVTGGVTFHSMRSEYLYDALGRLIERRDPGGAREEYEYRPASPVSRVIRRAREDADGSMLETHMFTDGHGRPLGTRMEAEDGQWRCSEVKSYNARKLEARSWLPYLSPTPDHEPPDPALPHERFTYDAQGRRIETSRPDGSVTSEEHRPLEVVLLDGLDTIGQGAPDVRRMDGLGRLSSVEERLGGARHVTRHGWNARGELESIADALGNVKRFRFDSLGRLIEVDDPDRGLLRFAYDDAGNRVRREDPRGQVIDYAFDAANRSLARTHRGGGPGGSDLIAAAYHHDEPAGELDLGDGTRGSARNTRGRLAWIEDPSGEEHFSYDERGNVEWVLKRILDPATRLLVSYRTERRYDLLGRQAEIVFPDNDRLRYEYGPGGLIARIDGGPDGAALLEEIRYAPSGQPLQLRLGNGVVTELEYDARQRLDRLRTRDAAGEEIVHEDLTYDAESNVVAIDDGRPLAALEASSPRRRTARLAYDELHRLTRVEYGPGGSGGRIDYAYDALGNLLSQSTPPAGQPGHLADAAVRLGAIDYAGGREDRTGRRAGDPPGPHAMTGTASGMRLAYDESGNVASLDGAALDWDFEDRLVRFARPGIEAEYAVDHRGRRVAKRVAAGAAHGEVLYVDEAFEVRDGAAAKYVLCNRRRLAVVRGQLDPTRDRVQRLVLAAGWILVSAAVESAVSLRDAFGADAAVYEARGASYAPVDMAVPPPPGKALWVHVPAARVAVLRGRYRPAPGDSISSGPLHAWPRLEPFVPAAAIGADIGLAVYDAAHRRWLRRDPTLPAFLSDAPAELGAAQAFWSAAELRLNPAASAPRSVMYYHQDHLDSTAALTDAAGELLEERTYHPYGAVRHVHRPGPGASTASPPYEFTDKERDQESGLIAMGARSYLALAGVFLSPDPRYVEVAGLASGSEADQQSLASFLADPQLGNLYAHALRNPLKYVDPSGLDVIFSKKLAEDKIVTEARALLGQTKEGQRIIQEIKARGADVVFEDARRFIFDARNYRVIEVSGWMNLRDSPGPWNGAMNMQKLRADFSSKEALVRQAARVIYHELRHAEANMMEMQYFSGAGAGSRASEGHRANQWDVHHALDTYNIPNEDPHEREFEREIGLWTQGDDGKPMLIEYGELDLSEAGP